MKLYAVVSRFCGERVHVKAFYSLERAEDFFEWKRVNINPNHPQFPADEVQLVAGDMAVIEEKGALAGAPRDAASASYREHDKDTPPPRRRAR